jgi:hypothetical protein
MKKKYAREGVITHKFIEMMRLLNIYLNHFPKHERHGMCANIRMIAYNFYDLCIEAHKRYHKKTTLTQIDITHEQLRMQLYLAYELGYFSFTSGSHLQGENGEEKEGHRYMAISRLVDELGCLVGAWIASVKKTGDW